ncbi:hypothetical protein AB751O23_BD_00020 [Chlamydiales bacterium SCGC AB-751-O23]|nr:hypothetical protein AB751O23_BD_00020 [Chlamydiales bacterium SCGC AB-751-O23]
MYPHKLKPLFKKEFGVEFMKGMKKTCQVFLQEDVGGVNYLILSF